MKINIRNIIIIFVLGLIVTIGISYSFSIKTREYKNDDYKVEYDSTWNVKERKDELKLEHKKSKSILSIQSKKLEENYIDTNLDAIISDIIYGVEKQNEDYILINMMKAPTDKYDSYSYLYEKDDEQVLVNVYKYNEKLVIVYYQANSKYYDIVLDNVDTILDSLEIYVGEKVN